MSHEFWAPKTVWILPLRIKPQTLIRMRSQHLHRGQKITLSACFPFKAWVWSFGEFYIKRMKIICLIPARECSHRMLWYDAPRATTQFGKHDLFGVTWKQTGLAAELWHPRFQIWDATTKLFPSSHGLACAASPGEGKKVSVLTNWKINSVAKAILFPNF